jgi:hypothetical protein
MIFKLPDNFTNVICALLSYQKGSRDVLYLSHVRDLKGEEFMKVH